MSHPTDALFEEMARIALHFGWPRTDLLALPHRERRRWLQEIERIQGERDDAGVGEGAWR